MRIAFTPRLRAFGAPGLLLLASLAAAQPAPQAPVANAGNPSDQAAEYTAGTQQFLDDAVSRMQAGSTTPLRMEVSLGTLDPRLKLAPCAQVEPFVPVGLRLWGKTRLGLRCVSGAVRWNVFLPVTIKAFGPAWVLRDNVMPGTVLQAGDAVEAEADWAADNAPVISDPTQWVGLVAAHTLTGGQPLRQTMVKAPTVFAAGSAVRILAHGNGFEVSTDGQALTPGVVGQPVRVRMENGRIANGVVQDATTVRLNL